MTPITEIQGDLFDAPEGVSLIHACNCQGSWGKGVAQGFREKYPAAYRIFRAHCQQYLANPQIQTQPIPGTGPNADRQQPRTVKLPEGTALVNLTTASRLPAAPAAAVSPAITFPTWPQQCQSWARRGPRPPPAGKKHWIICLFTSWHYGPQNRSPPDLILANTELAVADLKRQLATFSATVAEMAGEGQPGQLWGCRFNAGLFGVPWERTKRMLEEAGLRMTIVSPPGQ
ncbi:hypothetical protein PAAG_09129 [Paracoccidioides lutzii Pb01]|uniref:ADP-ribose 1''-phosphate phosphatase n=1 Tax=Paracoccidioides lutzii (strain ATCC MYA-826 / Pb01) TaxID=502779 RepID=C1HED8_PARBA|nr:hypothetical protein PAAG_09129 [Paracoccidioides lutzii Pb01]EEH32965.2 hypothetical protein PAAG_09129 [Paracoccidioides lutzii Pb01]